MEAQNQETLTVPEILQSHKADQKGRVLTMVALCRAAGLPARVITGISLVEEENVELKYWLEVMLKKKWQGFDPNYGYESQVPNEFLALRNNDFDTIEMVQGELKDIEISVYQELYHPFLDRHKNKNLLTILDLRGLPQDLKNEIGILLLLPIGILITAFFRHLVGVNSYGVFTPTILALSLVYTEPYTTSIIFIITCLVAIIGRAFFPKTMLQTPRLAIIFTLIALIISFSVSLLDYIDINNQSAVILLPIIILTNLVDRIFKTQATEGFKISIIRLIWTIIIALLCLPILQMERLANWILMYPEIHLISLAFFLVLSNYNDKKLSQFPLFKILAEPQKIQEELQKTQKEN